MIGDDTIGSVLWSAAARHPERPALLQSGQSWSFAELASRVRKLSGWLAAHGVTRGRHVALLMENSHEFVTAHYALASLGAVIVPLNHLSRGTPLLEALDLSEATLIVATPELRDALRSLPSRPAAVARCLLIGASRGSGLVPLALADPSRDFADAETLTLAELPDRPQLDVPGSDDPAVLFMTSGTTGKPKGIRVSHRQALLGIDAWVRRWSYGVETISLMVAPFFHVVYHPLVVGAHRRGGAAAVVGNLQARAATREAELSRASAIMGTPFFFIQLLNDRTSLARDLGSIDTLIYGAAPTPASVIRALREEFPAARLYNCYGLTETCSAVSCLGPEDLAGHEASVGRAHPGVRLSIRDEDGRELGVGEVGEVWCQGPNVIGSYYNAPEANASRFHDGWLRTGDMGYLDPDALLYLVGRCDDQINIAGEKIYPCEIENVLYQHADVLDAAVSVVPDPQKGQLVKAFVVPRSSAGLELRGLKRFCLEHLPPTFVPRLFELVDALPRNPSGKVVRRSLAQAR